MYRNRLKQYCSIALFMAMGSLAMMYSTSVLAQSSKCTVPSLNFPITPSGLTASTSELKKSVAAYERYQERIDAYNDCLVDQNKKRKYEDYKKRSATAINQEIRLYNLRNAQACKITFDSKTGSLITRNVKSSDRLIKALWELESPARIKENQTLNLGLRKIGIDITKSGRPACNNRYIYLRKSAQFYSLSKQCPLADEYASAAKKILNASKSDASLKKESKQLDTVINNIQICLKKEAEQRTKPASPVKPKPVSDKDEGAKRELQRISKENEILTTTNQELTEQLSNLQSELESTEQELTNSQQNEQKLNTIIEGLNTTVDEQKTTIGIYVNNASSDDDLINQLQSEADENSRNIAGLTTKVDNFEQTLASTQKELEKTQKELEKTQKELEKTKIALAIARGEKMPFSLYWFLLLIPAFFIGLLFFQKNREEELEELNKKDFLSDKKVASNEFIEIWNEQTVKKSLSTALKRSRLFSAPDKRTYFFTQGYLKYFLDHEFPRKVDFDSCLYHVIIDLLGKTEAYKIDKYKFDSDQESMEYFLKGKKAAQKRKK